MSMKKKPVVEKKSRNTMGLAGSSRKTNLQISTSDHAQTTTSLMSGSRRQNGGNANQLLSKEQQLKLGKIRKQSNSTSQIASAENDGCQAQKSAYQQHLNTDQGGEVDTISTSGHAVTQRNGFENNFQKLLSGRESIASSAGIASSDQYYYASGGRVTESKNPGNLPSSTKAQPNSKIFTFPQRKAGASNSPRGGHVYAEMMPPQTISGRSAGRQSEKGALLFQT